VAWRASLRFALALFTILFSDFLDTTPTLLKKRKKELQQKQNFGGFVSLCGAVLFSRSATSDVPHRLVTLTLSNGSHMFFFKEMAATETIKHITGE